jgi:peptide-methionine (S)-S-oxide reductase
VQSKSQQYLNAVFYHDENQKKVAEATMNTISAKTGRSVRTAIVPLRKFYRAEDYHQKYALTQYPALLKELRAIYPDINKYVDSTAVTRINGYVGGYGSVEILEKELNDLGLSPNSANMLLKLVKRREQRARLNPLRAR